MMQRMCRAGLVALNLSLRSLVDAYVAHVRHHLEQIQQRRTVATSRDARSGIRDPT
jgi:hypothetical protein